MLKDFAAVRSREDGATMVEMSIVLPIVLLFVLVIFDFSRVMTRHAIASNSLRTAARFGATFRQGCAAQTRAKLVQELSRFGIGDSMITAFSAVSDSTLIPIPATPVPGVPPGPVSMLVVSATIRTSCILCPVLRGGLLALEGDSGRLDYRANAAVPIEIEGGCGS